MYIAPNPVINTISHDLIVEQMGTAIFCWSTQVTPWVTSLSFLAMLNRQEILKTHTGINFFTLLYKASNISLPCYPWHVPAKQPDLRTLLINDSTWKICQKNRTVLGTVFAFWPIKPSITTSQDTFTRFLILQNVHLGIKYRSIKG